MAVLLIRNTFILNATTVDYVNFMVASGVYCLVCYN